MPGCLAGGPEVQRARRVLPQQRSRFLGEKAARRRHAALVVDHAQALAGGGFRRDGEIEVPAARPIHPARAQDEVAAARAADRLLPRELALAIDADRPRLLLLAIDP